jgi:outer membrane lipoprotein SlyB
MDQSPVVKIRSSGGPVDLAIVTIMIRSMMAMNQRTLKAGLTTALLIVLPACASHRPSLYSNEHLMRVGSSVAERDIDQCIQHAEVASEGRENLAENAAVSTAGSAAIGAAAGGAGGAVVGQAGQGAAIGAASSAAASLMYSLLRGLFGSNPPARSHRVLVDRCLREKGYEPVWK